MKKDLTPKQRVNRAEWKIVGYGVVIIVVILFIISIVRPFLGFAVLM